MPCKGWECWLPVFFPATPVGQPEALRVPCLLFSLRKSQWRAAGGLQNWRFGKAALRSPRLLTSTRPLAAAADKLGFSAFITDKF